MSKTIKLEDQTYAALETFRGKRETFSGAVDRLLVIKDAIAVMVNVMEGNVEFQTYKAKKLEALATKNTPGDSAQVRDVLAGEMEARSPSMSSGNV